MVQLAHMKIKIAVLGLLLCLFTGQACLLKANGTSTKRRSLPSDAKVRSAMAANVSDKEPPEVNVIVKSVPQKDWYDKASVWINLIPALIGAAISICTLKAVQKQVKTQQDASRGWIVASIKGQPEEPLLENYKKKSVFPGILWEISCVGNAAVTILEEQYRCRIVPRDDNGSYFPKPVLEHTPTYPAPSQFVGQQVYAPGTSILRLSTLEIDSINEKELLLVEEGEKVMCAYGRIAYKDGVGRKAISQFCAVYRRPAGVGFKSPDGTPLTNFGFVIDGPGGYNFNN